VFDLPDAQSQADVAQWKPIVAWLDPVLCAVRRPVLRGNPSVERPALVPSQDAPERTVSGDAAAIVAQAAAPSAPVVPVPASIRPVAPVLPRSTVVEPMARAAPARLGLFAWLTPRFLHR
jgi:hypothetical protein